LIVGVLAVQGDFAEHIAVLKGLGAETREVRLPIDVEGLDALIIPGGESTTQRRLLDLYQLTDAITGLAQAGKPIWGTCAGMIMLAQELTDDRPEPLHLMDITVNRNAYGRQGESFETDVVFPNLGEEPFHAVFIRAPSIARMSNGVEVLGKLEDGTPVAVRQGKLLATAFHPELTSDSRVHQFFLSFINSNG